MLDMLIKDVVIVDGTGSTRYEGTIGTRNGKIVYIGRKQNCELAETDAETVIYAKGLIACPGFIDAHSHGDLVLGEDYAILCKISQGITTEVGGQCGTSMFPVVKEHEEELKGVVSVGTVSVPAEFSDYTSFKRYAEYVEKKKIAANIKVFVGHGSLRVSVMGFQNRRATKEEINRMKEKLREAMENGALGLSSGLIYSPSCYADTKELIELAKVVHEYGGIYATHMRNESHDVVRSVKEALEIGKEAQVPVFISHHKICGIENWNLSTETLQIIEEAKSRGQSVTLDQYPYLASMTNINVIVPPEYFNDGVEALGKRVQNPFIREEIKQKILNPNTNFENWYLNCGGWENIMISSLPYTPEYDGMTFAEAAELRNQDGFDTYFDLLFENHGAGVCVYFAMCDEDLERIFLYPDTVLGTDGICRAMAEKAHPRAWGSFPHAINYFHKEKKLISLEAIIHKFTQLPAERLMIEKKGVIRLGYDADILLFDYDKLRDRAEYKASNVLCDGIEYVIIDGQIVYHDKRLTGVYPGKLLRHESNMGK